MSIRAAALLAALSLAVPPAARAGGFAIVEGFGGWQHFEPTRQGVANAIGGSEGTGILGGDVLLRFGPFAGGVLVDKTVSGTFQPWTGSILGGLVFTLVPSFALELLGELGRQGPDFGDMFGSKGYTIVGLRPGVSFRLVPSSIRFGVTVPVRWPTSGGDIGSPTYGLVGRIGFEFP